MKAVMIYISLQIGQCVNLNTTQISYKYSWSVISKFSLQEPYIRSHADYYKKYFNQYLETYFDSLQQSSSQSLKRKDANKIYLQSNSQFQQQSKFNFYGNSIQRQPFGFCVLVDKPIKQQPTNLYAIQMRDYQQIRIGFFEKDIMQRGQTFNISGLAQKVTCCQYDSNNLIWEGKLKLLDAQILAGQFNKYNMQIRTSINQKEIITDEYGNKTNVVKKIITKNQNVGQQLEVQTEVKLCQQILVSGHYTQGYFYKNIKINKADIQKDKLFQSIFLNIGRKNLLDNQYSMHNNKLNNLSGDTFNILPLFNKTKNKFGTILKGKFQALKVTYVILKNNTEEQHQYDLEMNIFEGDRVVQKFTGKITLYNGTVYQGEFEYSDIIRGKVISSQGCEIMIGQ